MTTTYYLVRHAAHESSGHFLVGRCRGFVLDPQGELKLCALPADMRE